MAVYYRREIYREKLFLKNLHLKKCKEKLMNAVPQKYSISLFVSSFKKCFPCVWEDIVSYCKAKKKDYERRTKNGLRTVGYQLPQCFLLNHIGKMTAGNATLSEEERKQNMKTLMQEGENKLKKRKQKLADNLIYVQEVCPPYVHKLIQAYFKTRKENTLDVNARYLILLEAAQFRCDETIEFLHKISACDKNDSLREFAFYALQRMGEHPWLARRRKGKKKMSQLKTVDLKDTPTELMKMLASHQHMLYQHFDVFLSHSSRDAEELLRLKSVLNSKGYVVYIDWVNDREMLKRENQDDNTWNVLFLRMEQSGRMLYVLTDNSIQTNSTEKEVCYFKSKGKAVYYYQPGAVHSATPSYLKDCIEIKQIEDLN